MIRAALLCGLVGHLLCWYCDILITYTPGHRFHAEHIKDNAKLAEVFSDLDPKRAMRSLLLGVAAITLEVIGLAGIACWMYAFSPVCAVIIAVSAVVFGGFGSAHHVICAFLEWMYVKQNRTEESRVLILEFFKKTAVTMIVCYIGLLLASGTLLYAVLSGMTSLPRWAAVFNLLPAFAVLMPLRTAGAGNIAGAFMFAGLLFLI